MTTQLSDELDSQLAPRAADSSAPRCKMPSWKQRALTSYYSLTWPLRKVRNERLAAAGRAPIIAVVFHRVADDWATRWTISNAEFQREIAWLQQHFELVSLAEAQRRIAGTRNDRPTVAITFDDGYAENCDAALPLLLREQIPFTYFVTSGPVLDRDCFHHDIQAGHRFEPNTVPQLRDLVAAGVEIGAHTRTHADLGSITDPRRLYDEMVASRDALADVLGCRIRYFAFPFGQHANLSRQAFSLAKASGFEAAVSAYGGYNFPGDDPFHIQRACVDGPLVRLKNWVTVDPYKQWRIPRFQYT